MKGKKARKWLIPVIAILLLLHLCSPKKGSIPLRQERDQIKSIELIHNPDGADNLKFVPFFQIGQEEWDAFLDDLQAQEAIWLFNDPSTGFGELIVCITYQNGDMDLIGYENNAAVVDGKVDFENWYFDNMKFKELFEHYAGDAMPEGVFPWLEDE
ncbi:MAG: hypothetical protein E7451_05580 [Ruminococcaceae bacterium]|nr:hypothetical protein [Oscillospiraceae bacterium]